MDKGILIVGYPGDRDKNYCAGVLVDLEKYKSFFSSLKGGAWNSDEINVLLSPEKKEFYNAVHFLNGKDYSIFVFSGHGYFDSDRNSTMIELNDKEDCFPVNELKKVKNRLIILDCCRVSEGSAQMEHMAETEAISESVLKMDIRDKVRAAYEKNIEECINYGNAGVVTAYSCSINERARDDPQRGGIYSYHLLSEARKWTAQRRTFDFRSIFSVHNDAFSRVFVENSLQHPVIRPFRGSRYYPFSVSNVLID